MRRALDTLTGGQRAVAGLATVTMLASVLLIYQANVRARRPPEFTRGGTFAQAEPTRPPPTGAAVLPEQTPVPRPTAPSRSSATIRGPVNSTAAPTPRAAAFPLPAEGTYTYLVTGSESATVFGSRDYPEEMTMGVHREADELGARELVFDLRFSAQHEERQIVAFRPDGVSFVFEGGSVSFGPVTETSEATYDPPLLQAPLPLRIGTTRQGTSQAIGPEGEVVRTEDWTVQVIGRERISVEAGRTVDAWKIETTRQTTPESEEQITRTRTYWLDATRGLWVQWTEERHATRPRGLGDFEYDTTYTATLDRFSPP